MGTTSGSANIFFDSMPDAIEKPPMEKPKQELRLSLFGRTDVGQVREHNEDNFLVANLSTDVRGLRDGNRTPSVEGNGLVIAVCDGMGGAAAGEVASQLAVDIIYDQFSTAEPLRTDEQVARCLVNSIEQAGYQIFQEARADRSRRGMGTTATVAAFRGRRLFFGQVGDSRAYLLRDGKLVQVTRDQSLVNQLIEAGQLTEEEAETFEHNNIILQALGTSETVQVDLTYADVCAGDVLMMCSDGLSGMIRGEEIQDVLETIEEPLEACRELTQRANRAGGHDNITVIVARFGSGFPPKEEAGPVAYQKFSLPDVQEDQNDRPSYQAPEPGQANVSEEAQRENRKLRVSHTMVGVAAQPDRRTDTGGERQTDTRGGGKKRPPLSSIDGTEETPASGTPSPRDHPDAGRANLSDPPIELPTHGLPPLLMAILVMSAMALAALLGYLALR